MVELKNVNVHYKDGGKNGVDALHDINLRINDGEFVFIEMGRGAGKITMLQLLTRDIGPTTGRVFVNRYNISRMNNRQIPYFHGS